MNRPPGTWWAVEWYSANSQGRQRHLVWRSLTLDYDAGQQPPPELYDAVPLFRTRDLCRAYIERHYGYIRTRPDLTERHLPVRQRVHGWHVPQAVLVALEVTQGPPRPVINA